MGFRLIFLLVIGLPTPIEKEKVKMSYFDKIKNKRPDKFIRQVGISLVNFHNLLQL
jgi:hypothetical protein